MKFTSLLAAAILTVACTAALALPRDAAEKAEFRRNNPCPSTGKARGACPGHQVDHKQALMNGGTDKPNNMQWLKEHEHKAKTRQDIAACKGSYLCKSKAHKKKLPWQAKPKKRSHKAKAAT